MVDYGAEVYNRSNGIACGMYFKKQHDLCGHLQACHTLEGIADKKQSEAKMLTFFKSRNIVYSHDQENRVTIAGCPALRLEGNHARPDFQILDFMDKIVLVCNDEDQHRSYGADCELYRMFKIASVISAVPGQASIPILYIRFNPHYFRIAGVHHDLSLAERHRQLERVLNEVRDGTRLVNGGLNIWYMFYDRDANGRLSLFNKCDTEWIRILEPLSIAVS